jgi:hypothetical protein
VGIDQAQTVIVDDILADQVFHEFGLPLTRGTYNVHMG